MWDRGGDPPGSGLCGIRGGEGSPRTGFVQDQGDPWDPGGAGSQGFPQSPGCVGAGDLLPPLPWICATLRSIPCPGGACVCAAILGIWSVLGSAPSAPQGSTLPICPMLGSSPPQESPLPPPGPLVPGSPLLHQELSLPPLPEGLCRMRPLLAPLQGVSPLPRRRDPAPAKGGPQHPRVGVTAGAGIHSGQDPEDLVPSAHR